MDDRTNKTGNAVYYDGHIGLTVTESDTVACTVRRAVFASSGHLLPGAFCQLLLTAPLAQGSQGAHFVHFIRAVT